MTKVRVYDIVMEDGTHSLQEITLAMKEDYDWTDVFQELDKVFMNSVESYSYKEIKDE